MPLESNDKYEIDSLFAQNAFTRQTNCHCLSFLLPDAWWQAFYYLKHSFLNPDTVKEWHDLRNRRNCSMAGLGYVYDVTHPHKTVLPFQLIQAWLHVLQMPVPWTLRWRHNGHDSVSNHHPHECLLNHSFRRRWRKHQSSASLAFVRGIHRGPVNSPHKWPVMRKMRPFDDVIMN